MTADGVESRINCKESESIGCLLSVLGIKPHVLANTEIFRFDTD